MSENLTTARLLLRKVTPEVYEDVFTHYSQADAMEFFGCSNEAEFEQERQRYEGGLSTYRTSFLVFHLLEKASGRVIGSCGYHTWYKIHSRAEIGYGLLAERYKGQGLMKEAFLPVLRYGFEHMHLNRIEAFISPANAPSLKLVRGHGFTEEGMLREHYYKNGQIEDSVVYSLLKKEFQHIQYKA